MILVFIVFLTFTSSVLSAQIALIVQEKDFVLYDIAQSKRLENLNYSSIGGVWWRFSSDSKYLFYKMNPKDNNIIKRNFIAGTEEIINVGEIFEDFQVVDEQNIAFKSDIGYYLFNYITGEKSRLSANLRKGIAPYFAYDKASYKLILQTDNKSLELWDKDGKRTLLDVNLRNIFTYRQGVLCYSLLENSFIAYLPATNEKKFYAWPGNTFELSQVWYINEDFFMLSGTQEGKNVYRIYNTKQEKIEAVILDLVEPILEDKLLPRVKGMSMVDFFSKFDY